MAPGADDADIDAVLDAFRRLPPHEDVAPALAILGEARVPAVAFSNGGRDSTDKLLEATGLDGHFAHVIGVEGAGAWKPHRSAYRHAADELGLPPGEIALVAVHSWDIHGARRAGLVTGWCSRLEGRVSPVFDGADVAGDDLVDVVERLLQLSQ